MVNLEQLSKRVRDLLKDDLVSMAVFGSYARGDYNRKSDVDLIVVVRNKTKDVISKVMKLEEEISIRASNWVDEKSSRFLNMIGFKKSIFLFDENEFKKKKFNFCDSRLLSKLLIPKGVIWSNIKRDGKVVYGKDIIAELNPKISIWDKIKAPMPGIGACAFAAVLLLFNKERAIELAQTGLRWTYMNVMGVLHRSTINSVLGNFIQILKIAFKGHYSSL